MSNLFKQNPALDIEEDPNEISGEFGDHSTSTSIVPLPKVINDTTLPLPPSEEQPRTLIDYVKVFRPHHMKALIWKNFLWMWRNVGVMAFIIGLPCLQIILFCWAIGHDPKGLKLAISDHELARHNFTDCPVIDNDCCSLLLSPPDPEFDDPEYVNLCFSITKSIHFEHLNNILYNHNCT